MNYDNDFNIACIQWVCIMTKHSHASLVRAYSTRYIHFNCTTLSHGGSARHLTYNFWFTRQRQDCHVYYNEAVAWHARRWECGRYYTSFTFYVACFRGHDENVCNCLGCFITAINFMTGRACAAGIESDCKHETCYSLVAQLFVAF